MYIKRTDFFMVSHNLLKKVLWHFNFDAIIYRKILHNSGLESKTVSFFFFDWFIKPFFFWFSVPALFFLFFLVCLKFKAGRRFKLEANRKNSSLLTDVFEDSCFHRLDRSTLMMRSIIQPLVHTEGSSCKNKNEKYCSLAGLMKSCLFSFIQVNHKN